MKGKRLNINIACLIICLTIAINVMAEKITFSSTEATKIIEKQQNMEIGDVHKITTEGL
ncbi:MAG: hypothetical protein WBM69_18275 [Desulfobacterales bacterium]